MFYILDFRLESHSYLEMQISGRLPLSQNFLQKSKASKCTWVKLGTILSVIRAEGVTLAKDNFPSVIFWSLAR